MSLASFLTTGDAESGAFSIFLQSAIRFAGPFGLQLVQFMMRKRIMWTPPSNIIRSGDMDFDHITQYCYHNWALKKSGEVAFYTDLHPVRPHHCPVLSISL